MADSKHSRHFSEEFKRQIVQLYDNSKSVSELQAEYDIGHSTLHRWIKAIHENGSTHAKDNRTPEEQELIALERKFNGYKPHTHIVSDLTYVRVGRKWNHVCLLIDLYNREIVGHAAAEHKDASLVKAAFATLKFSLFEIEVFHTDRGSEIDNMSIDEMFEVFNIQRSLSQKGCPYDNAVIESANKSLKSGLIYRQTYNDIDHLRRKLNHYVWWYNNKRIHSTLDYLSSVEFKQAGLSL